MHDPFYSADEIKKIASVASFDYPNDLRNFDAVIVAVPHSEYTETPLPTLIRVLRGGTLVIDAEGAWDSYRHFFKKKGIDYRRVGDAGWASSKLN